jgi:hypothetical protein
MEEGSAEGADGLEVRAEQLHVAAHQLLTEAGILDEIRHVGEAHLVGSVVSQLMTHREIDITVAAGSAYGPSEALALAATLARRCEVVDVVLADERSDASVAERDRRLHLQMGVRHAGDRWELDISLFALDAHENVAEWHQNLRSSLTPEQRRAILRIKSDLVATADYPGGLAIYNAVLNNAVTQTEEFLAAQTAAP